LLFGWSGNRGTSFGPFVWPHDGLHYLNQHIFRLEGYRANRRWLYWTLKAVTRFVEEQAHGIIGMVHVTKGDLGVIKIPLPSPTEQHCIAAFLDRETAKIDALVAKKERLIELLQEKRTALISHAVTRGLNPNAPLRDSGIPWIGRVPVHWRLKRFRHVTTRVDVGIAEAATHAYADVGVPILRSTNVRANMLLLDDVLRVQPWFAEKNRSKYLLKDDILTVRTGNAGVSAVVPEQLHRSQCFTMLMSTLRNHQDARFYCYFLNSSSGQTVFAIEAWGTAQANISVPILKEVPVVEPPYEEQARIVAFIEHEAAKLDGLMAKIRTAIDRLQEYRTALISAAVTGQIDVREAA
jgi:type I restriction enzyme S subunit